MSALVDPAFYLGWLLASIVTCALLVPLFKTWARNDRELVLDETTETVAWEHHIADALQVANESTPTYDALCFERWEHELEETS